MQSSKFKGLNAEEIDLHEGSNVSNGIYVTITSNVCVCVRREGDTQTPRNRHCYKTQEARQCLLENNN